MATVQLVLGSEKSDTSEMVRVAPSKTADALQAQESKKDSDSRKDTETKLNSEATPVSFVKLFRFATPIDIVLTVISIFSALCCGAVRPCLSLVLGKLFNSLNVQDQTAFNDQINTLSITITLLGVGLGVGMYVSTCCASIAATNQSRKLRESYFKAMLRQDMAWIDTNRPGEAASRLASDTVEFQVPEPAHPTAANRGLTRLPQPQVGVGEQLSQAFVFSGQFAAGVIVGLRSQPLVPPPGPLAPPGRSPLRRRH